MIKSLKAYCRDDFSAITCDLFSADFCNFPTFLGKNIIWDYLFWCATCRHLASKYMFEGKFNINLQKNIFAVCLFLIDFEEILQIYQLLLLLCKKESLLCSRAIFF